MGAYIKAITALETDGTAATYFLIPVDGVNALTFGGTPGAAHILNIYYNIMAGEAGGTTKQFRIDVTIPNGNTTSAADIRAAFYKAMSAAIQNPGSLPLLLENDTVVTSAAAGASTL